MVNSFTLNSRSTFSPTANSFTSWTSSTSPSSSSPSELFISTSENNGVPGQPPKLSQEEEEEMQWNLFLKNHARGQWRGTWTTYNFMGDVIDNTMASVNLLHDPITNIVSHTHDVVVGSTQSDCETCFDSSDVRTIPVANYSKGRMAKYRCASIGMSCGPSITKSGSMSTELILSHEDTKSRLRVVYQHAPVWEKGVEPGSRPPDALKLYRVMVAKETLFDADEPKEAVQSDDDSNKKKSGSDPFQKAVPPFQWHKKWAGTAWTWGSQTGDRGWSIAELEEADAWHGRPTGDNADVWSLRLNKGGILLQCPRIIQSGFAGICRVAWLPEVSEENGGKGVDSKLLRMEASVMALEPIIDEEQDVMLGFYPPSLGSLRCDTFAKIGELEDASIMDKLRSMGELDSKDATINPKREEIHQMSPPTKAKVESTTKKDSVTEKSNSSPKSKTTNEKDSDIDDIRNALKL